MRILSARSLLFLFLSVTVWVATLMPFFSTGDSSPLTFATIVLTTFAPIFVLQRGLGKRPWLYVLMYVLPLAVSAGAIYLTWEYIPYPKDLVAVLLGGSVVFMIALLPWAILLSSRMVLSSVWTLLFGDSLQIVFEEEGGNRFYLKDVRTKQYVRESSAATPTSQLAYTNLVSDALGFSFQELAIGYAVAHGGTVQV